MATGLHLNSTHVKRGLAIAFLLLLGGPLLGLITSAATSFPVAAQLELEAFLRARGQAAARTEGLARASRPWNLSPELGLTTSGDGLFFETDLVYDLQAEPSASAEGGVPTSAIRPGSGTPLPYPPEEAWCVLLQSAAGREVIVLARHHREPYQSDWVIHEQPADPTPSGWIELTDLLGCRRLLQGFR
jgi:hypothetical protein